MEWFEILLGVIISLAVIIGAIIKGLSKRIAEIAKKEIGTSQESCYQQRAEVMRRMSDRVSKLETHDNDNNLVILAIQKDIKGLSGLHEQTQALVLDLNRQFQDTTKQHTEMASELIKTIQQMGMK